MFALELGLTTIGLGIAFLSRGHRRWIFNLSIVVFLAAMLLGSVTLVVAGVAMLGLGSIEKTIASDRSLRMRIFAVTGVLLLAAIVLPTFEQLPENQSAESSSRSLSQRPSTITSAQKLDQLSQLSPMDLLAENKELVNEIAHDVLGKFRKRALDVVKQNEEVELSTTIEFKAPSELLDITFASHNAMASSDPKTLKTGRLKLHASLNDATTCNQCHDVGSQPLHAALYYDWSLDDPAEEASESQPAERSNQCDPDRLRLDPDLFVHAN
ncbi:MAG: hypothetical protein WBD20_20030 [Pirellulaceae bacterium]